MRKNILRKVMAGFMVAAGIITAFPVSSIYAADEAKTVAELTQQEGSLTIIFDTDKEKISGATFSAYQVAELAVNNGNPVYSLVGDFKGTDVNFNGMTEKDSKDAAEKLMKKVTKNTPLHSAQTGSDGKAIISGLSCGMYLIAETAKSGLADEYTTTVPFLVSVPEYNKKDNVWIYGVEAEPKAAVTKITKPDEPGNPPSDNGNPSNTPISTIPPIIKMGDNTPIALMIVILAGCAAGIVYLIIFKRKMKK